MFVVAMHNLKQSRQQLTQMMTINLTEWRTKQVKKMCNQLQLPSMKQKIKLDMFYMSDKHKYVYCSTPKVASSSWIHALLGLDFKHAAQVSIYQKTWAGMVLKSLQPSRKYKPAEVLKRLKNYYTFMFVREPLERLVSAYRIWCVTHDNNWLTRAVHRHCNSSNKGNNEMQL